MRMHDQVKKKMCCLTTINISLVPIIQKKENDNNSLVLCPVNQYNYIKASDNNKKTGMIWNSYKPFKTASYLLHSIAIQ